MTAFLAAMRLDGPAERPVVLLHGFGATRGYWKPVLHALQPSGSVVAFDLPGHGESLMHPGSARTSAMAEALIAEFDRMPPGAKHLVGHSMGGAVACLVALKRPDLVASLTLLAPGGFGPAIAAGLLRRHAAAGPRQELEWSLSGMRGDGKARPGVVDAVLADRSRPGVTQSLVRIGETFLHGDQQGVLPIPAIASTGVGVNVLWGRRDRVTPVSQAMRLPAAFRVAILENAGHSLVDEHPETVVRFILEDRAVNRRSVAVSS